LSLVFRDTSTILMVSVVIFEIRHIVEESEILLLIPIVHFSYQGVGFLLGIVSSAKSAPFEVSKKIRDAKQK
jgi:hypothetical protein